MNSEWTVAEMIERARRDKGLSQRQVAEKTGLEQSAISRYEVGRTQAPLPVLLKLVEVLELDQVAVLQQYAKEVSGEAQIRGQRIDRLERIIQDQQEVLNSLHELVRTLTAAVERLAEVVETAAELGKVSGQVVSALRARSDQGGSPPARRRSR